MNLQSVSGEAPKPGGALKKYFDHVNSPKKRYQLQSDPTERSIQIKAQQFLAGDLLYIPTDVLLRLKDLRHISAETCESYSSKMPNLSQPNKEQKTMIETFHENLKPYLEKFAEGNTFLK